MKTSKDVIEWYEEKTKSILRKYGPGPIVHFHTGLVEPNVEPESDIEGLRRQLVRSQEKLLLEAVRFWEAGEHLSGFVIDVGCGLGGSSIFFAREFGARVYALTNVPGHIGYIKKFAAEVGVNDKVIPVLGDACAVPGEQIFDAAVAIESSCYLNRLSWFLHLSKRLRKAGPVFIADCYTENPEVKESFDRYWLTRIGSLKEYEEAANNSGFKLEDSLDLTPRTTRFWEFSVLHSRLTLETLNPMDPEAERLRKSIDWQTRLMGMWNDRKITCMLLHFVHL